MKKIIILFICLISNNLLSEDFCASRSIDSNNAKNVCTALCGSRGWNGNWMNSSRRCDGNGVCGCN